MTLRDEFSDFTSAPLSVYQRDIGQFSSVYRNVSNEPRLKGKNMKRILPLSITTAAILVGAMSTSFAMTADHFTKVDLKGMGYSDAVVSQLDTKELAQIAAAMHNGDDSDARQAVSSLILHFTN